MKIVISDPKTRKAWQIEKDVPVLIGKKIGDEIDGSVFELSGFKLKITGGSDKEGFPMRSDLDTTARKKILLASGVGYRPKKKGIKRRKYVRGNTVSDATAQLNVKVIEGENIEAILGKKPEEGAKEEGKKEENGEKKR